jgi:hypothetical protein
MNGVENQPKPRQFTSETFAKYSTPDNKSVLCESQSEARRLISDTLSRGTYDHVCIIITGLQGTGKDLILNQSTMPFVRDRGGTILSVDSAIQITNQPTNRRATYITTATLQESELIKKRNSELGLTTFEHIIKPMNEEEAKEMLCASNQKSKKNLTPEEIDRLVPYSMGVPLLLSRFTDRNFSLENALDAAVDYLIGNFPEHENRSTDIAQFFQMPIPQNVLEKYVAIKNDWTNAMKMILIGVNRRKHKMEQNTGRHSMPTQLNPTIFNYYQEAMRNPQGHTIDIFVPGMSEQNWQDFAGAIGLLQEDNSPVTQIQNLGKSPVLEVFGADTRETGIIIGLEGDSKTMNISAGDVDPRKIHSARDQLAFNLERAKNRVFPPQNSRNIFFQLKTDDENLHPINPIRLAFMIEALLRKFKIPYAIDNRIAGQMYYNDHNYTNN